MLSHVHVGVTQFDRAYAFYDAVMKALGYPLRFYEPQKAWAGWKPPTALRPLFLIGRPFDGQPAAPGNGQMVALLAPKRAQVDEAYRRAIEAGGSCDGPPGPRPQYHFDYYGAYVRDPDGNKLCICCHDPA